MASIFDILDGKEQEGGTDAPVSPSKPGAIDSLSAESMASAIRRVETGGDYKAKGASGEYGAYQFMPDTWTGWSKEYGKSIKQTGEIEPTKENQDAVAKFKLGQWIEKGLTAEQIAAKWNSGSEKDWENKVGVNDKGVAYDVPGYVRKVTEAMKGIEAPAKISKAKEEKLSEGLGEVLAKTKNPKLSKMEEMKTIPSGILQEMKAGVGDMLTTTRVLDMFRDHEKQIRLGMNDVIAQLPHKERKKFLTEFGEATPEEKVQGLIKVQEGLYRGAYYDQLKDWHDKLGESSPMKTSGLLRHADITARGMSRFAPTMVAGSIPVAGKVLGPAAAYMQIMGPKFEEYAEAGIDPDRAFQAANMAGIGLGLVESASDMSQVNRIMGRFKKAMPDVKPGFIKGFLKSAGTEGLEELSQAHLEVIFDVWAGGADLTGPEMAKKVFDIYRDPSFQRGAWQEAAYGAAGGGGLFVAGSAVAGATKKLTGVFENETGSDKPGEGELPADGPKPVGPGRHFQGQDKSTDVRVNAPNDAKPNVDDLMGVTTDDLITEEDVDPEAQIGEKVERSAPGRTLSDDLTTTPEMQKQQKDTNVSISGMLEDMEISQNLKRSKIQIQNNERQLEDIEALYSEAVVLEDTEEALSLAEEYKELAAQQIDTVGTFMATRTKDQGKKKALISQSEKDTALIYNSDLGRKAGTMVTTQVQKIRMQENQEFMDFSDELYNNMEALKTSLVQQETQAGNAGSGNAKMYRKMADLVDARRWMGDDQFYGKKVKLDKALEFKGDLERKIAKEKNDIKVSGYQKAVDDASLAMVDEVIRGKAEYDTIQEQGAYAEKKQAELQADAQRLTSSDPKRKAAQAKKTAASTKKQALKRQPKTAGVGTQHEKITKQKKAERATVAAKETKDAKTSELDKRRAAIQKQKASAGRAPVTPVSPARKAELEASKARKAAVKKQVAEVAKAERKPHSLPKKAKVRDLQDKKSEYVILTPDNPQSTQVPEFQNRRARLALKKELDEKGIDYEIVDAVFEGNVEKSFIIKGMDKKAGKELSDRLNQSSYIHAKGENIALIEGKDANVVKKADAKVKPDAEIYSVIEGKRWAIPFYSDKAFDMDAEQLQLSDTETKAAKTKFRSAGIKFGGKVYEGNSHMDIINNNPVLEDFFINADITEIANKAEHGFVSHDGKFSDRFTATRELNLGKDHYLKSEDFMQPVVDLKAEMLQQGIDTVLSGEENKAILDIVTESVSGRKDPRGKKSTATERQIRNIKAVLALETDEVSPKRKIELRRKLNDLQSGKTLAHKMTAPGMKNQTLADQMGTLELMDELKNQMKTGKYKWAFDKTKAGNLETIFVTAPGQYTGLASTKKVFPDMKNLDKAGQRFDGGMKLDPKTGQMQKSGGTMGIYHKDTNTAIINLPIISKRRGDINKAMETLVHEHVHGLHKLAFDKMSQPQKNAFGKEITNFWESIPVELRNKTRDNPAMHPTIRQGIIQADESVNEIVTYAMAHPEFANWLDSMPASPRFKMKSSKIKTMWDALVNMIVKTINPAASKLNEVTDILNRHLKFADPGPRFSKEDTSFDFGDNVSTENVAAWAKELDDLSANGIPSTVVETAADAAELLGFDIADNVTSIWVPESEQYVMHGKPAKGKRTVPAQVVIIAENIQSRDHLVSKWMHEQVGHQGLRNTFPNNALLKRFLDQSYAMFNMKNKEVLDEIVELYDIGRVDSNGKRKLTVTEKRLAAEEVIARRSEKLQPSVKKGLVNKFKAFLNKWLPKKFLGFKMKPFKMADSDIMSILEMAKVNVLTGQNEAGVLLQKKLDQRAPKHKFAGWKTLPNFMFPDKTYVNWIKEVHAQSPGIRKWYDKHQDQLHETFGPDAALFNILLSVTSPQADVNTNVIFAAQTYAYMMGLTEKPGALYANKLKKNIDEKWTTPEKMFKALESPLFKVTEFVRGLNGDVDATVGDMWMYRAFFGDAAVYDKENDSYSIPQTVAMRQKIHDLAAQMSTETGETYTAREVQAAIWVHINAKSNDQNFSEVADYQSGFNKPAAKLGGKTPLEWLQDLIPNLKDGPLGEKIGVSEVPMAPISPLAKKRLDQVRRELAAQGKKVDKFDVAEDGTITVKANNVDEQTLNMIDAIADGGRRVQVPEAAAEWHRETFGFKEVKTEDGITTMVLSDEALAVFTNPKGIVTPVQIRDNLGGYSGTYTQTARFSREARSNLDQIAAMSTTEADAEFLRTGNDGMSVTGKIHEWRDQSELNWNRFTDQTEQEFLSKFGGRKSMVKGLGSKRLISTPKTELLQKAMNLYIDSGTGENLQRAKDYLNKLSRLPKLNNRQKDQVMILDRMMNLSQEEIAWAEEAIRPYYEDLFTFAKEHKIIESHVEDYVKRSWKIPKEWQDANISWSGMGTSGFTLTPTSGKQRTLNSIVDGWDLGMDLNTEGVIGNLQNYGTELGYVFANRRFVKYMRSLINFDAESLMMEGDGNFKPPAGFSKVTDRGFVKPGKILYARNDFANELNKLGSRPSRQMWDSPIIKFIRKINAMLKGTILSVSLFHHLAGLRSYAFGVNGKGFKFNGISAYKRGLAKIDEQTVMDNPTYEHLGPVVDYLVREGLTLGKTQDWDQTLIQDSMLENMLMSKTGKGSATMLAAWRAARRAKRSITTGLFGRLFAGLKAEAAAFEFGHNLKIAEKKHKRALTESEIKLAAAQAATMVNADFGGLHLKRMGRNPDLQKLAQVVLLAPDWTESNWRTVTGMIPGVNNAINKMIGDNPELPGMGKVYRRFWKGAALRIMASVALANVAILGLFGDDDDKEDYFNMLEEQFTAKNFIKGKWLSVPVDPIIPKKYHDPEKRRLFSIAGHFKDILKMVPTELDPLKNATDLLKHKVSPVARVADTIVTRQDWKGARFTTAAEMLKTGKLVMDNQFAKDAEGSTMMSLLLYNARASVPIAGSELLQAIAGETTWISAVSRSLGAETRDVRRTPAAKQKFEKESSKINELERNLKEARTLKDQRMIFEARRDIRDYPNFNKKKSKIGQTKRLIQIENRKIKQIKAKQKQDIELTEREEKKLRAVNDRKQAIYDKAITVLNR